MDIDAVLFQENSTLHMYSGDNAWPPCDIHAEVLGCAHNHE
jgi:hypothetical protein